MTKHSINIPDKVKKGNVSVIERLSALDKIQLYAVLATDMEGQPYASLIAYKHDPNKNGIIFVTPRSTRKYKNILCNSRVSLLIDTRTNTKKDYMGAESIMIIGDARSVRKGRRREELARIFLRKHPYLKGIIQSQETALVYITIKQAFHVTKFQTVSE